MPELSTRYLPVGCGLWPVWGWWYSAEMSDEGWQDFPDYDECDESDYDDEEAAMEEALQNCGMQADGQCLYAGSEDCDECPIMDDMIRAQEIRAQKQRRGDTVAT